MTTHVFVVNENTLKFHLEYLFAGTGAKDKQSPFLASSNIDYNATTERMLTGMIADISRIRIGDKVVFYLQATKDNPGMFFGMFKAVSNPFFNENDNNNYLKNLLNKGLSFRVLIEPDEVYAKGITEHEYLDSLKNKEHAYDLCWSLIYRKLKGNRGCTMIMDYEYDDLLLKLKEKNNNQIINSRYLTFDRINHEIVSGTNTNTYQGIQQSLDIKNRLVYKYNNNKAFETHLQAFICQNFDKPVLSNLLIMKPEIESWIGNEVSCGVGMQRIDVMLKQEDEENVYIRLIELKDEEPYENILKQISWYLKWLSEYVLPHYSDKTIKVIPTIIAKGALSQQLIDKYQQYNEDLHNSNISPLEYIGFSVSNNELVFTKFL